MRRFVFVGLLVSLFAGRTLAQPAGGSAGPAPAAAPATAPANAAPTATSAPANAASPTTVAIREGLDALHRGEVTAAVEAFHRAVAADRGSAEAHYYLATGLFRQEHYEQAHASFHTARQRADEHGDVAMQLRARIGQAEALEREPRKHAEARDAWLEVLRFAEANPGTPAADLARGRIQALDQVQELATRYEPVRHRIREREHHAQGGGAAHAPNGGAAHHAP